MTDKRVVLEFSEVKAKWLSLYNGDSWTSQPNRSDNIRNYRKGNRADSFYGCSPDDMASWLRSGFTSPSFPIDAEYSPSRPSRRMVFAEDGELDLTLAWSGHDYPYLEWETQQRKPGIRIEAGFTFSASVEPSVIAEYGAWLYGILEGLETMGYDIELDLSNTCSGMTSNRGGKTTTLVRLKRENELSDFTEWSAMFSPGGFRMLYFTALGMAADKLGEKTTSGLGAPVNFKFDAIYDTETATLKIDVDGRARKFDLEGMSRKVNEAIGLGSE